MLFEVPLEKTQFSTAVVVVTACGVRGSQGAVHKLILQEVLVLGGEVDS